VRCFVARIIQNTQKHKTKISDLLDSGKLRAVGDTSGGNIPCEPIVFCEKLTHTLKRYPARIVQNSDTVTVTNQLRHNEVTYTVFDDSQLSSDISMDVQNDSVIYVTDTAVAQTFGAFIFRKDFKYKLQFNNALLSILPGRGDVFCIYAYK
jgi:hypothetical protein